MPQESRLIDDVALAVTEACTNSIVHGYRNGNGHAGNGNGHTGEGTIRVVATHDDDGVHVTVSDDGSGMAPRTDSPGLGLGLGLLVALTDAMSIEPAAETTGTVVTMHFVAQAAA
jgi:anti-sigma regulatory factor (Ser/Thr protein kinase)